jgi:hypothetical protein
MVTVLLFVASALVAVEKQRTSIVLKQFNWIDYAVQQVFGLKTVFQNPLLLFSW